MKNVLMVTYHFYPNNRIATQRTVKLAKYLPTYGWNPLILCTRWTRDNCTTYDLTMEEGFKESNVVAALPCKPVLHGNTFRKILNIVGLISHPRILMSKIVAHARKEAYFHPERTPTHFYKDAISTIPRILHETDFDVVWATSPSAATHAVADWIFENFGVPWVADFRDIWDQPWVVQQEHTRNRHLLAEPKVLRSCAAIVTVSAPLAKVLEKRNERAVAIITNGFDPDDYSQHEVPKGDRFNIVYTGNIRFPHEDPAILFDALESFAKTIGPRSLRVCVSFYGTNPSLINELVRKHGHLKSMIRVLPSIPHETCVITQQQAHVLLHLSHPETKGVFTGKIFEYLAAGRPILSIPGDGDVVDSLLRQTKAGVVCRNVEETAMQLLSWYQEWKEAGTVSYFGVEQEIRRYSRKEQARQLAEILDQISGVAKSTMSQSREAI